MNKYIKYIFVMALSMAAACEKGPVGYEVDGNAVVLEAYGPNPVLRGADLTFIGQNMDKITSVILPTDKEIISSEFKEVSSESFKVTVPMDCDPGSVTLIFDGGTITAKTELSYTEPFEITSISPVGEILEMGDSVTVEGEYLNNIVAVGFINNVTVPSEEFGTHTRYMLKFAVPKGAISGVIYVADANGNNAYSSEELTINQPAVSTVSPETIRPGDEVTVSGMLLDQIESLKFAGSEEITAEDFVSASKTAIKVIVPDNVHDGKVTLTTAAGETLETENSVTVKVPSEIVVKAADVFKAGHEVEITGNDVDLVTGASFGTTAAENFSNDGKTVKITIPATAVDGPVTLSTAAEKTVNTETITLVKPVITSLGQTTVVAGETFDINGTDLDLITEVTLNGTVCEFQTAGSDRLTVSTTAAHNTGKVAIKAANGYMTEYETELTVTYNSRIIVTSITETVAAGEEVTISGSNFNMIEAVYFGDIKITSYTSRSDTELVFVVPEEAGGTYNPRFILTTGEEETCPFQVNVTGALSVVSVWTGSFDLGSWAANLELSWGANPFGSMPYGATIHVEYTTSGANAQLKLVNAQDWSVLTSITDADPQWGTINVAEGSTHISYLLNNTDIDNLVNYGLVVSGQNAVITSVYYTFENAGTKPVSPSDIMLVDFEGNHNHTAWAGGSEIVTENGNNYLRIISDVNPAGSGAWIINCNDRAEAVTVENIEEYSLCLDVLVPQGWSDNGTIISQFVFSGWHWYGASLFSGLSGNGKWQTLKIPVSFWNLTGRLELAANGEIGLFLDGSSTSGLPVGMCFDNLRLSK